MTCIESRKVAVESFGVQLELISSIDEHSGMLMLFGEGTSVAHLSFETTSGQEHVRDLFVSAELRRQGVATFLWDYARERVPQLRHDHLGAMTEGGLAFARAVGGDHMSRHPAFA